MRNPPLLEGTEDLTNLSYLNEPAGKRIEIKTNDVVQMLAADPIVLF